MIRKHLLFALFLSMGMAGGCYHMRITPQPLPSYQIFAKSAPPEALAAVERLLNEDDFRLESVDPSALTILTGYRFFHNDSGFGQPPGGRDYFYRLQVTLRPDGGGTRVTLSGVDFELRSFYVYEDEGHLSTLKKRYPYEEYPGMFDLDAMTRELVRVQKLVKTGLAAE